MRFILIEAVIAGILLNFSFACLAGTASTTSSIYSITPASLNSGDSMFVYIDGKITNQGTGITLAIGIREH